MRVFFWPVIRRAIVRLPFAGNTVRGFPLHRVSGAGCVRGYRCGHCVDVPMPVRLVFAIVAGVAVRAYCGRCAAVDCAAGVSIGAGCIGARVVAGAGNRGRCGRLTVHCGPVWPVHDVAVRAGVSARDGKGRIFYCVFSQWHFA